MAKTSLNENVDKFFKTHTIDKINESSVKENLHIKETNDYGSILHAIINYKYDETSVLKTIEILLNLGVDPNYKGSATGMTFIHLAFYGYTTDDGNDYSYSEDFIIKLITLAKKHDFNANIKDNDSETPVEAAIASEVYTGSISRIIESLMPDIELNDELKRTYEKYLKEAKSNQKWHKRLIEEKDKVFKLIDTSNLSLDEIEKNILAKTNDLEAQTNELNYDKLKATYLVLSSIIKELISLMKKRELFDTEECESKTIIKESIGKISNVLELEVKSIETNPTTARINDIKPILEEFLLSELLELVNSIASDYENYLETLRNNAANVKTVNEGKEFILSIKGNEIESELENIVSSIIENLNTLIDELKTTEQEDVDIFALIEEFSSYEYEFEEIDYDNLTAQEIEQKIKDIKNKISSYKESVMVYITKEFSEITSSVKPLISSSVINEEEVISCLKISLNSKDTGVNNSNGHARK